eukprot:545917-Pelagomonas_calceolata.AAC.2
MQARADPPPRKLGWGGAIPTLPWGRVMPGLKTGFWTLYMRGGEEAAVAAAELPGRTIALLVLLVSHVKKSPC